MNLPSMKLPSAFLPLAMSLTALGLVLGHVAIYGVVHEADEGAAAHLWQLLMGGADTHRSVLCDQVAAARSDAVAARACGAGRRSCGLLCRCLLSHVAASCRRVPLPRPLNLEGTQTLGLALIQITLDEVIHAAAARSAAQDGPQFWPDLRPSPRPPPRPRLLGIAHPAAQVKLAGLPLHKPAKAHPLHPSLNQKNEEPSLVSFTDAARLCNWQGVLTG